MKEGRWIPLVVSGLAGLAAAVEAARFIPAESSAHRTNLVGETRTVPLTAPDGARLDVDVELTAWGQTRSLFAAEAPYLERTRSRVRLTSPATLPAGVPVETINAAVAEAFSERVTRRRLLTAAAVPRLDGKSTEATAETRRWRASGIVLNGTGLLLIALAVAGMTAIAWRTGTAVGRRAGRTSSARRVADRG